MQQFNPYNKAHTLRNVVASDATRLDDPLLAYMPNSQLHLFNNPAKVKALLPVDGRLISSFDIATLAFPRLRHTWNKSFLLDADKVFDPVQECKGTYTTRTWFGWDIVTPFSPESQVLLLGHYATDVDENTDYNKLLDQYYDMNADVLVSREGEDFTNTTGWTYETKVHDSTNIYTGLQSPTLTITRTNIEDGRVWTDNIQARKKIEVSPYVFMDLECHGVFRTPAVDSKDGTLATMPYLNDAILMMAQRDACIKGNVTFLEVVKEAKNTVEYLGEVYSAEETGFIVHRKLHVYRVFNVYIYIAEDFQMHTADLWGD